VLIVEVPIAYFLVSVSIALFMFGFIKREYTVTMVSSILTMCTGIYVMGSGLNGVSDWMTQTFGFVYFFFGVYIMIRGSAEMIDESVGDFPFNRLKSWIRNKKLLKKRGVK